MEHHGDERSEAKRSDRNLRVPEVNIYGENQFDTYTRTRIACRAVIVQEGKILLIHMKKGGEWMIPGGGLETGETPEECCIREAEGCLTSIFT